MATGACGRAATQGRRAAGPIAPGARPRGWWAWRTWRAARTLARGCAAVAAAGLLLHGLLSWRGSRPTAGAYAAGVAPRGGGALAPLRQPSDSSAGGSPALREAALVALRGRADRLCRTVFAEVDHDDSGTLSATEVHIAVLLVIGKLNQLLGSLKLDVPKIHEVRRMISETKVQSTELTEEEFTDFFQRTFLPRIAARAIAHVLTRKVLIPLAGITLNVAAAQLHVGQAVERRLTRHETRGGFKGMAVNKVKDIATHKAVDKLSPVVGSVVSMQIVAQAAGKLQVESRLGRALGDSGAEAGYSWR